MNRVTISVLSTCLAFMCLSCTSKIDKVNSEKSSREVFVEWGKQHATPIKSLVKADDNSDLKAIADAIGDAKVLALSEGFHNCKEMMQLHERLIRYLVEEKGFNTVMTESGFPESRMVYDFIHGKDVKGDVYKQGFNKMYGAWEEGRSLINWMKEYNQSHKNVLGYYGADIGGFYTNWYPPVKRITDYLQVVDSKYAKQLTKQLDPILEIMGSKQARLNYQEKLSAEQKAKLAIVLDKAVEHFNTNEETYVAKSGNEEFQWARQSTIAMRMAENYYRNYGDRKAAEPHRYAGLNGRELMMSHNVQWALKQRKDTKIILINHVIHTKTKSQKQDDVWGYFTPMAQIIKQNLGDDFFVIGLAYGGGKFWNKWQKPAERFVDTIQAAKTDGIETTMCAIGNKPYFLHWEKAPSKAQAWLNQESTLRENDYYTLMEPIEWNACIYLNEVNPATAVD